MRHVTAKESAGVKDDAELSASLRAQGTSLDAVRRQWERDFIAEEYLRNRIYRGVTPARPCPTRVPARRGRASSPS